MDALFSIGWFSLGGLLGSVAGVVGVVTDLGAKALPLLAVGAGIKHVGKVPLLKAVLGPVTRRIPNDLIPFVNLGLDLALGGGGVGAAAAALLHQGTKIITRNLFGARAMTAQNAVGPGNRVSI